MAARLLAFFVRHGTTALNESHSFRGPLNPALDEKGIQDAGKLKELFRNQDLGEMFTSNTLRSQTTANMIAEPHDVQPMVTSELNAWNVGHLGGKPKANHQDEIDYHTNHPDDPIPGGESLNQFKSRVRPAIRHIVKRGVETGLPSLAVVHSSIIHELGSMFHGNHSVSLVRPGGVVGVFHSMEKGFHVKPLLGGLKKGEGYGG